MDVLLGLEDAHLMAAIESRSGGDFEPIASRTRPRWIVRGVIGIDVASSAGTHTAFVTHAESKIYPDLDRAIKHFCDTDTFGSEQKDSCVSPENQCAITVLPVEKEMFGANLFLGNAVGIVSYNP